jgi:transposase-like protein
VSIREHGSLSRKGSKSGGKAPIADKIREILKEVGQEGESAGNWEEVLEDLKRHRVQKVRIFISDDLPGLEEAITKVFPEADRQLCVLYAVRAALNKVRKKDREALAEDPKGIHRAEEALRNLRERWETRAYALLVFLHHPKPIRRYLSTTNFLERLAEEMNRRTKMVGVFLWGRRRRKAPILGFESAG